MTKQDSKKEEIVEETASTSNVAEANVANDQKIEELEQRAEECESKYKRALADYQNLQKRVTEEKGEWIRAANKDLLLRLLPVLDTLMLAAKHLDDQGLTVSINQFLDTVKAEGVTQIKTVGEDFDPHLMECVTTEAGDENNVLKELRAGYMLYDKVLRPAQVTVGKS